MPSDPTVSEAEDRVAAQILCGIYVYGKPLAEVAETTGASRENLGRLGREIAQAIASARLAGFRAGAEAMREQAVQACQHYAETARRVRGDSSGGWDFQISTADRLAENVRALPLPTPEAPHGR